ncbi:MAG: hypothetical protein Q8J74_04540 [Candidatus Didemnitutus sp.]|nr:hypothetical protein [Candidatus Didemnitutus sp.]
MHTRLLSFLSDIERALATDDPNPDEGTWEATRTVNYTLGLARLVLGVRKTEGLQSRGSILLQSYQLADGTPCLKAALSWFGSEHNPVHAVFSKSETNWTSEARKIGAEWMAGPPAAAALAEIEKEIHEEAPAAASA